MKIVKSLWQQLQESKSESKQLDVEDIKKVMTEMFSNKTPPTNWIPASLVLSMNDENFKLFMKTKQNYRVTCNLEQLKALEKRFKENEL